MRSVLSSVSDDEFDSSRSVNAWWRSTAMFDEYVKLKPDLPSTKGMTPGLRVLRELERLALAAPEGISGIRQKLQGYSAGDLWVPTGGIKKEELDIPPLITVLLVGFTGAGKSSLVNLMYSVLSRSGLILFAQTSSGNSLYPTTLYMEEHNVLRSMHNGFCVYDSRGSNYDRVEEGLEELASWMNKGVHHNQLCAGPADGYGILKNDPHIGQTISSSRFATRMINCAMVVADMADIYKALKSGDSKPLEATRELFSSPDLRKCNEDPILILTHGDMLSSEDRIDARVKICEFLGVSETDGVYDIVCLTEYGFVAEESDCITAYSVSEAAYRAMLISDRSHLPKKNITDWLALMLSWFMFLVAKMFACLADVFSRFGHRGHKLKKFR